MQLPCLSLGKKKYSNAQLCKFCTLFPGVNFFKRVVTEVVLFSIVAFKKLTFHKVV